VCPDLDDFVMWITIFVFFYERNRVLINKNSCRREHARYLKEKNYVPKNRLRLMNLLPCFSGKKVYSDEGRDDELKKN
jgi:hypothetical protein